MAALCKNLRSLVSQYGKLANQKIYSTPWKITRTDVIFGQSNSHLSTITQQTYRDDCRGLIRVSSIANMNLNQRRFKKKRAAASKDDKGDEEEDDGDDDDLANENPLLVDDILNGASDGSQQLTIDINSLRLDVFCKSAFAMTRAKVEEMFYKGDIYVNGELPHKKSVDIGLGDEIDVVKQIDPENNKLANIRRAIVVKLPDKATEHGRMKIDIKRWMDLTIESPAHEIGG